MHPLPFVANLSQNQDICHNPDIGRSHGFSISPVTCSVVDSLIPIFSQSKPSVFADILYPSVWYWIKLIKGEYDEDDDMEWEEKQDLLYWTGSATGGYATLDNWRDLHRQRLVLEVSSKSANVTILEQHPNNIWSPKTIPMSNLSHLFDLRITSIPPEQCEPAACEVMRHAFLKPRATSENPRYGVKPSRENPNLDPLHAAYAAKYVLDLDGNAFSGRFYRLLLSNSAVLKQTVFREWHDERLVPWVHFIPISPEAGELGEVVRFLTQDDKGRKIGEQIARQGREWAQKTLRMVDLELTMLRILMEYGRVINDERDEMNFVL